jgi:hypothetical protein
MAVAMERGERLVHHRQAPAAVRGPHVGADVAGREQRLLGLVQAPEPDQRVGHADARRHRRGEVVAEQAAAQRERIGEAAHGAGRVPLLAQRHPQAVREVIRTPVLDAQLRPHRQRAAELDRGGVEVALRVVALGPLSVHLGVVEGWGLAGAVGLAQRDALEALGLLELALVQGFAGGCQVGEGASHPHTLGRGRVAAGSCSAS